MALVPQAIDRQIAAHLGRVAAPGAGEIGPRELRRRLRASRAGDDVRPDMDAVAPLVLDGPDGPLRCRLYRPAPAAPFLIVFFHGGGWVTGDLDTADATARRLAAATGADVLSVDYRLAPEHRFPAALRDAEAAVRQAALLCDGRPLAVAGDSAGGALAATCAAGALDVDVAAQLLAYPVTDADLSRPSHRPRGGLRTLTRDDMAWYWDQYVPDRERRLDPSASPLRALELASASPAVIVLAHHDPLLDEGRAYAARLRDAGVPVRLLEYPAAVHGFLALPGRFDIRDRALAEAARALRELVLARSTEERKPQ